MWTGDQVELKAEKRSLRKLLSVEEQQFRIPPYQRPYAWTAEQVDDLWDDLAGNITLFGHFNGSIHFGNPTGPTASSTGTTDTFLVKLRNTDWSHVWTIAYGKSGNQYGWSVAVTGDGTTITGGEFYGDLDVPTAPLISATSGADLFAVLASP